MATVVKDFKIKSGLKVEGTTGTINNFDILTKKQADQDYIVGLIGGTSTSANTPDTVVKRDGSGNFAAGTITADVVGDLTGNVTGNADTATALETARTIAGQTFDGTQNVEIAPTDLTGVNATAEELNILDGATVTTAELNYVSGVTSAIQTQLDDLEDAIDAIEADTGLADHNAATSGVHGVTGDVVGTTDTQTLSNKTLGSDLAAGGFKVTGLATPTDNSDAATKQYVDEEVAALVDGAPALLDTLNELAAALGDNPDTVSNLQTLASGKQNALTAGDNISIVSDTISVTGLDTDDVAEGSNKYFTDDRAVTANTGLWDTIGAAATAETNANQFTTTSINALNTGDIEEGSNLYFTDARAQAAVAANITTAIDALDTDDIEEGSTNLYFTNTRARDAVATDIEDAVAAGDATATPTYLAVDINSVSKQVAATQTVSVASQVVGYSWAKADYKSAELLVKTSTGTHSEISRVMLTLDSSDNVAITEYAMVGTNGTLQTVTASVNGNDVEVLVTTSESNSTVVVAGTLVK